MSEVINDIVKTIYEKILANFSFYTVALIFVLLWIVIVLIKNPDKANLWSAAFSRFFSRISSKASKKAVEKEINGRILRGIKNTSKEIGEILPYQISFSWQEKSDRQAFFDSNQVVLFMDPKKTKAQNIIHAINGYVCEGLVPHKMDCLIDPTLSKAQKMVLTKKIVSKAYKDGLRYYIDNYFTVDSEELKTKIENLQRLDNDGLCVQIALKELCSFHMNHDISLLDASFGIEYSNFIDFLTALATRKKGEDTSLSFTGNYIKVGVILAASDTTYNNIGDGAYVQRFQKYVNRGLTSIYIRSRGNFKNKISISILESIKQHYNILNFSVYNYTCEDERSFGQKGVCIYIDAENMAEKEQ